MKKLKVQVNYKKYDLFMSEKAYQDNVYMGNIKIIRRNINFCVKNNVYRKGSPIQCVCAYSFISATIDNPTYVLHRINETQFYVVKVDDK
ncbi:MAG: hypothetical protein IJO32_07995 [Bacilli bacterium]|nr:hypothetical protein [Bacilli bacterium]